MRQLELVLATGNKHKVEELKDALGDVPVTVKALRDMKRPPKVIEDGETLRENAVKKALTIALHYNTWALADDTGLEVDYIAKAPGVYSARFAGPKCSYQDNNKKLLKLLKGVPTKDRTARFRCVVALCDPDGNVYTVEGSIEGRIASKIKGNAGFGYDPLFEVPTHRKTFAELDAKTKNRISHRGKATRAIKVLISEKMSSPCGSGSCRGCGCK